MECAELQLECKLETKQDNVLAKLIDNKHESEGRRFLITVTPS